MVTMNYQVPSLITMPPEIILYIFSFLDLPDLEQLSIVSPAFRSLAADPVLHRMRVQVVAPSRIRHFLFARGGHLRPTVGDLVQRGVIRGLNIERRWRDGLYFYSPQASSVILSTPSVPISLQSVKQYWTSINLQRAHARHILSSLLDSRPSDPSQAEHRTIRVVFPHGAYYSHISSVLLPVVRQLLWSFQRDRLARIYRDKPARDAWIEDKARGIGRESERVRLAICPGVRRLIRFYEGLSL